MSLTFADLGVPADLVAALATRGITSPFPVQAATIPDLLAGRDVCGRAPTGSGKTLAFGLPLLTSVRHAGPKRPSGLVLAPTRELAAQIQRELEPLAAIRGRKVLAVYGGVGYDPQRKALRRGVDVLVACPGRLADLIQQGAVRLDGVDFVVIDEADRMADMGFLPEVRKLLDGTSSERQTALFSATLDGDIAVLTRDYQRDPARHEVGEREIDAGNARHFFWRVETGERVARTAELITAAGPTIVFCRTRRGADRVAEQLGRAGVRAEAIHGGRPQGRRDSALRAFTTGRVGALVATDVAARGIHVDAVACVVHFDLPEDVKAYLHRSGRTARAGAAGSVVTLVGRDKQHAARRLHDDLDLEVRFAAPDFAAAGVPSEGRPVQAGHDVKVGRAERQPVQAGQAERPRGDDVRARPPRRGTPPRGGRRPDRGSRRGRRAA